jgi:hypothetical protein
MEPTMKKYNLQIAKVQSRGNKFGIIAGKSILARFKTAEKAIESLKKNRGHYEYWADSMSVQYENAPKKYIIVEY